MVPPRDNGSDSIGSQEAYDSGFIREEQHPDRVLISFLTKKNRKIQICIDFRDLNEACPKDEFPLPITNVKIENTCGFEWIYFMDRFSGYNQIKMDPDESKMFGRAPKKSFFLSLTDYITIDQCQADRTLVTS